MIARLAMFMLIAVTQIGFPAITAAFAWQYTQTGALMLAAGLGCFIFVQWKKILEPLPTYDAWLEHRIDTAVNLANGAVYNTGIK